jgi:hypothetical protein
VIWKTPRFSYAGSPSYHLVKTPKKRNNGKALADADYVKLSG